MKKKEKVSLYEKNRVIYLNFEHLKSHSGVMELERFLLWLGNRKSKYLSDGYTYLSGRGLTEEEGPDPLDQIAFQILMVKYVFAKYRIDNRSDLQHILENYQEDEDKKPRERKTHKITIRLSKPEEEPLYEALSKKDNVDKIATLMWIVHSYWKSGNDPLWVAFAAEQAMLGLLRAHQRAENKEEIINKVFLAANTPITSGYIQDAEKDLLPSLLHVIGYDSTKK